MQHWGGGRVDPGPFFSLQQGRGAEPGFFPLRAGGGGYIRYRVAFLLGSLLRGGGGGCCLYEMYVCGTLCGKWGHDNVELLYNSSHLPRPGYTVYRLLFYLLSWSSSINFLGGEVPRTISIFRFRGRQQSIPTLPRSILRLYLSI